MALATPTGVVLELMTMGQQSAAHLGELLRAASPPLPGEHQTLAAEILRCCDRVIAALRSTATGNGKKRKATDQGAAAAAATTCHLPVTPSKRRARGTEGAHREVEINTMADGFMWRKYGQKDINGSNHPRIYYRCAYRGQGCIATRRVQLTREEPLAFAIAYYGHHTCGSGDVACQQGELQVLALTVVDSGADGADRSSPPALVVPSDQGACRDGQAPGETKRRGWPSSSSSSSSSEVGFGDSPVLEFLEGCFDWEAVVNYLGSGDLPQTDTLQ